MCAQMTFEVFSEALSGSLNVEAGGRYEGRQSKGTISTEN